MTENFESKPEDALLNYLRGVLDFGTPRSISPAKSHAGVRSQMETMKKTDLDRAIDNVKAQISSLEGALAALLATKDAMKSKPKPKPKDDIVLAGSSLGVGVDTERDVELPGLVDTTTDTRGE